MLLDEKGNLLLTYTSHFREKGKLFFNKFENNLYSAPEVAGIQHITVAADWWSYGAILFEMLTGMVSTIFVLIKKNICIIKFF